MMLFDTLFSGSEEGVDAEFAEALREANNVLLPFAFVSGEIDTEEYERRLQELRKTKNAA